MSLSHWDARGWIARALLGRVNQVEEVGIVTLCKLVLHNVERPKAFWELIWKGLLCLI